MSPRTSILVAVCCLIFSTAVHSESNWPSWRGPIGNGHTTETEFPVKWDASSVLWKVRLRGNGQSSPVIWGNRIFLTSALEGGKERLVLCLDVKDGSTIWEHTAWTGAPEPTHKMNGWASATCATDGEVVVAFFGKGGLHAYSVDGKHLWSKDLGTFENPWGTAACPIIVGDLVIQNGDSEKNAFIEAFDRKTGESVWRQKRSDHRGWSTPVLVEAGEKKIIVLNGHEGVTAYDPSTGSQLWFTPNSRGRGEPTVTPADEFLYVVCGLAGEMYALRRSDDSSQPQVVWKSLRKSGRDLSSPIVVGNYLLVTSLNGIASCYDAMTGKELWKERLVGQFSSTPIAIGGLVYYQNELGETVVIEPGPKLQIVAQNSVGADQDEIFRASLTPHNGRIYSRSNSTLYCIGGTPKKSN